MTIDLFSFLASLFLYSLSVFVIFLLLQPVYCALSLRFHIRQHIREVASDGASARKYRALHKKKQGTPTGAGILIWGSVLIVVLLSRAFSYFGIMDKSLLQRSEVYLPLFSLVCMGILGAVDDFWNTRSTGGKAGMSAGPKMFFVLLFAICGALWFFYKLEYTQITLPYFGMIDIGIWSLLLYIFVIVGTAHAVNITDGLDGLSGGLLITSFSAFGVLSFLHGHHFLSMFCGIIVSALFAFLWFNVPPAKFFMGDTGSLALGATLGVIAMMTDTVYLLPLIGIIFVVETLSVIIQVGSKKLRKGKQVFLVAPLHHHFEAMGWTEPQIVMRFWIIGAAMAAIGLLIDMGSSFFHPLA